jgi:hypothetical protein
MKRKRLLRKYKIQMKENLDQVIEELKQKVPAKTQRLSRYKNRQNQYYQNKMFRTDCKKFYNLPRHTNTNVKKAPSKEDIENFWRATYGYSIMKKQTGSKTSVSEIPVWNGVQYLKQRSQWR